MVNCKNGLLTAADSSLSDLKPPVWEFPGGPMVETAVAQARSLVGEIRSCKPRQSGQKEKKRNCLFPQPHPENPISPSFMSWQGSRKQTFDKI